MRIAGFQPDSIVDGPGIRFTIYVQGCPHRCPGCHNPETHDPRGGFEMSTGELATLIDSCPAGLDGVTFSGGEPFEQAASLARLAGHIRSKDLDLVIFSGYTFEELLQKSAKNPAVLTLLQHGRLLVDGPFYLEQRDSGLAFRGSRNQRLIDLPAALKKGAAVVFDDCRRPQEPGREGERVGGRIGRRIGGRSRQEATAR